jgi:hypothetical protein
MRIILIATLTLMATIVVPSIAQADSINCKEQFTIIQYRDYAKPVYKRITISNKAHLRLKRMETCQHSDKAKKLVETLHKKYLADRKLLVEMRFYMAHPMPSCTWLLESGVGNPEWSTKRYTMWLGGGTSPPNGNRNVASGKFQFLRRTWHWIGGDKFADVAAEAIAVIQERFARILLKDSIKHWVNC